MSVGILPTSDVCSTRRQDFAYSRRQVLYVVPTIEAVGSSLDDLQWSTLLFAISGFEAYRRQHHMIYMDKVVEFFLLHPDFPRSVLFCVENAADSLRCISGPEPQGRPRSQPSTWRI